MAIGNFKDINESNEVNETKEYSDNTEKTRNQILDYSESYNDGFDRKLDEYESRKEMSNERREQGDESVGEKASLLDKMRNLFSKKETGEESEFAGKDDSNDDKRNSFLEDLRKDAPTMEEQVEKAKGLFGRDDYLEAREKSEQEKRENPDLKSWELSPEQLSEVRQGQVEIAKKGNDEVVETSEGAKNEGRTSGGDAWEKVFGSIEEDE